MIPKPYTYKTMPPEWREVARWATADTTNLEDAELERFERFSRAIAQYLTSGKLSLAAQSAQVSGTALVKALNRCLTTNVDQQIVGWVGLLPGVRLKPYERVEPLPQGSDAGRRGSPGAFQKFLAEHPDLKERMDKLILRGRHRGQAGAGKQTFKAVVKAFITMCRQRCSEDQYPLNSDSKGRKSVERYVRRLLEQNPQAAPVWFGRDLGHRLLLGTGQRSFPLALTPMAMACADAHQLHAIGVVVIPGPSGPRRVPLQRIWLYLVADTVCSVAYDYSVAIHPQPSSAHLEQAFENMTRPWSPRQLRISGLTYRPSAGLPSGVIPGMCERRLAGVSFDNAAQHYGVRVVDTLHRGTGCAIRWNAVGAWWQNAIVERVFKALGDLGLARLPSSTGTGPTDPLRPDSVEAAVRHEIEWEELLDLVDVVICNFNATPQSSLGGATPLEVLASAVKSGAVLPPMPIPPTVMSPRLGISIESGFIRGAFGKGKLRSPYVSLDGTNYSSPSLAKRFDLIGKPVIRHITFKDLRTIEVFLENGEPLGVLTCLHKGWQRTPHDRDMRKEINRLIRIGALDAHSPDLVEAFTAHLASKAVSEAKSNPRKVSPSATKLADVLAQTRLSAPMTSSFGETKPVAVPPSAIPVHIASPTWEAPSPWRLQ